MNRRFMILTGSFIISEAWKEYLQKALTGKVDEQEHCMAILKA